MSKCIHKAPVGAFNKEKVLVDAISKYHESVWIDVTIGELYSRYVSKYGARVFASLMVLNKPEPRRLK